ncbi:hypothetical protein MTO96_030195 [Rhipicephalus appendiculatus]
MDAAFSAMDQVALRLLRDVFVDFCTANRRLLIADMGLNKPAAKTSLHGATAQCAGAEIADSADHAYDAAGRCDETALDGDELCGYARVLKNVTAQPYADVIVVIVWAAEAEEPQDGLKEDIGCRKGEWDDAEVLDGVGAEADADGADSDFQEEYKKIVLKEK